jgi:hypothetical protein
MTFAGEPRNELVEHVHEATPWIKTPLVVLSIMTALGGFGLAVYGAVEFLSAEADYLSLHGHTLLEQIIHEKGLHRAVARSSWIGSGVVKRHVPVGLVDGDASVAIDYPPQLGQGFLCPCPLRQRRTDPWLRSHAGKGDAGNPKLRIPESCNHAR